MSRTIRRPQSLGWYESRREFEGRNKHWKNMGYAAHWHDESWEHYILGIHKDGTWAYSTPSWWIKEMHTVPRRAKEHIQIQKVYKLIDYEDVEEFPLDKKPHIYYW